jgi:HAE1 family hydrophobic/amphiphilic exporter-1
MIWLTKIALKKRWLTILVAALVAGASIWATLTLKMELIPDIEFPMTTVITVYPQAQPEEVMSEVTVPVEGAIAGISGLKHITSTSTEGSSFVFAQFEYGTDMDKVNDIIAQSLSELDLPSEVRSLPETMPELGDNPRLFPIDINMMPVAILSLSGDVPAEELQQIAVEQVMPRLEAIDGVYSVAVEGGAGDKILIDPAPEKMSQAGISLAQLIGALAVQQYDSLSDIEDAFLNTEGLRLKDVAGVSLGPAPGTAISRTNGETSININVTKDAQANTVTTANGVLSEVKEIESTLPAGLELVTILDQSEYIENSISDLTVNALIGSALAIVIVFLFLLAFRASLVTAVSIPLSLLIGFLVMRFTNITVNILTLSAMVIAVGRVIDNSIVILEVVFRHMQQGEGFRDAAINGVKEVVTPITSATIATVVIFIPLAFVGGIVGEMFVPFALTITFALIGSLLVALTVVPALSGFLGARKAKGEVRSSWYLNIYTSMLKWCLTHRVVTLVIAVVLFIGSFALLPIIGTSFMPEMNSNMLTVDIEMPEGTDLSVTNEAVMKVESVLSTNPDVLTYNTTVGSSSSTGIGLLSALIGGGGGNNSASIMTIINPDARAQEVAETLRQDLGGLTQVGIISVESMQAMSAQMISGLEISVHGDSYEDVALVATQLSSELEALPDVTDLETEFAVPQPQVIIEPDPLKVMTSGLSLEQIQGLEAEFLILRQGGTVAQVNLGGVQRDIFVEGVMEGVTDIEAVEEFLIGAPTPIAVKDIATVEFGEQVDNIQRIDQKIAASITGTITQEDVGAVNRVVQSKVDSLTLPAGVDISMGGIMEEMMGSFSGMFLAIGIAVLLAFVVLVVTFRSFRNPLIIMVSLPLASIGAMVGLLVTGHTLGVTGLMGVLMLVGIVLTNAVVLIAVVEQLRGDGLSPLDALLQGARTRLRPILMTALTTMIAMLPLAFGVGEGVIMATELAVVVIGGLFSSTLLTLLVVPVIYSLFRGRTRSSTK